MWLFLIFFISILFSHYFEYMYIDLSMPALLAVVHGIVAAEVCFINSCRLLIHDVKMDGSGIYHSNHSIVAYNLQRVSTFWSDNVNF